MQIKTAEGNQFTPTRMTKVKKTNNTKDWQGYEANELSYIASQGVKCPLENS